MKNSQNSKSQQLITRYLGLSSILATGALLQACGGEPNPYNDPRRYSSYYQGANGACQIPPGIKSRTIVGNLGNGATLTLDIFQDGSSARAIAAYGMLSVPSVESLYGLAVGSFNQSNNLYGYAGGNSGFQTCVSSNNFNGTLEQDSTYQDINLALTGNGNTYIEMGDRVGIVKAFVTGNALKGSVSVRIGSYPQTDFILP